MYYFFRIGPQTLKIHSSAAGASGIRSTRDHQVRLLRQKPRWIGEFLQRSVFLHFYQRDLQGVHRLGRHLQVAGEPIIAAENIGKDFLYRARTGLLRHGVCAIVTGHPQVDATRLCRVEGQFAGKLDVLLGDDNIGKLALEQVGCTRILDHADAKGLEFIDVADRLTETFKVKPSRPNAV